MQTIIEIKYALEQSFATLSHLLEAIKEDEFNTHLHKGKWNAAQQTEHLSISNAMTVMALNMPKQLLVTLYQRNKRENFTYEEIVSKYQQALQKGAKATFAYQPKLSMYIGKKSSINLWKKSGNLVINALQKWDDNALDEYIIPHPLIGKITPRELLFFTIYHIEHHCKSIKSLYKNVGLQMPKKGLK